MRLSDDDVREVLLRLAHDEELPHVVRARLRLVCADAAPVPERDLSELLRVALDCRRGCASAADVEQAALVALRGAARADASPPVVDA
jgi:hypothetical protein